MTILNTSKDSETSIYLTHSPVQHIIPLSDNSILTIGFDRNIYQYDCDSSENWAFKRSLTKDDSNPLLQATSNVGGEISASIQERLKQFGEGLQKKQSMIVTSNVQRNIHLANVNSASLSGNNLITSDYAGFVKVWNL